MQEEDKGELQIRQRLESVLRPLTSVPKGKGLNDAAVLILIRKQNGRHLVLLEKRAVSSSDPWSGQVAFPGGRFKSQDGTLDVTACREFFEETNVNICKEAKMIGYIDPISPGNHPEVRVIPFLAVTDQDIFPTPSAEVQKFFWAPLEELNLSEYWFGSGTTAVKRRGYTYQGEIIWGMTERLIEELRRFLCGYPEEANS